jgi:hypothetical protein
MDFVKGMMGRMMGTMSADNKREMMDQFFSGMSDDDKKEMMQSMMPKMMEGMMGTGKGGMMGMMSMMGAGRAEGESFNPMDMCRKMMGAIGKASDLATFATPEIRGLFEEWVIQIEEEIMQFVKAADQVNPDSIAEHFKLSKESAMYFLTRLAQKGKISLEVKQVNQP